MAYKKKPRVTKKTVKKEGPSTSGLTAALLGGVVGREFLHGFLGLNTASAAGQGVKKTTIKRVH